MLQQTKTFIKKTIFIVSILTMVFSFSAVAGEKKKDDIKVINFGIISTESTANLQKGFDPFLKDMEKAIGIKVRAFFAADYAGVIEAMRFNKVQVAWFGNKSAIEAVDRANGEVFAQTVDAEGNPGYWSLIIAHKNSPLNTIEDIIKNGKNLNFGNGDVNSTSGYLIPGYYIWSKNNIDPKTYFKTARNSTHGANIMAVANKQVDFATNNTENYGKFKKSNPDKIKDIKIIWKSPLIPSDPFVWRKDLPKELKAKIKAFILSYGRTSVNKSSQEVKRELQVLAGVSSGFAPFWDSSNKQLIPIREIKFVKDMRKIENDKYLSADDKKRKIAVIQKKINELKRFAELLEKF